MFSLLAEAAPGWAVLAELGLGVQLLQLLQLVFGGMKRYWGEAGPV